MHITALIADGVIGFKRVLRRPPLPNTCGGRLRLGEAIGGPSQSRWMAWTNIAGTVSSLVRDWEVPPALAPGHSEVVPSLRFYLPAAFGVTITDNMRTSSYGWAAMIILFAAAGSLGLPPSVRGEQPQPAAPAAAWEEKIIAEVTLETNLKVTGGPEVLQSMPEEKR